MLGIIGVIAAAYWMSAADRLRGEETDGHLELLLATTTTRRRWAAGHYVVALGGVALLLLVVGLTMGVAVAVSLQDSAQFGRVVLVALAQIPAAWVMTSLMLALFGWAPRATVAAWGVLVVCIVLGEFGELWSAPDWLMNFSPFQHTPHLPATVGWIVPLLALTVTAAVFGGAGFAGWRRRDTPA